MIDLKLRQINVAARNETGGLWAKSLDTGLRRYDGFWGEGYE